MMEDKMRKTRKPTMKERISGGLCFIADGIKSFFVFEFEQAQFDFYMIVPTIRGQFDVVEK